MRDVTKRPQPLVGEAEVVPLFLFFGQPDPPQRVLRVFGRNPQVVTLVHGFTVSVAASVGYPGAVAGAQDRLDRGHQSARGNHGLDRPALANVHVGLAVGNHEQGGIAQLALHINAQPFGGPERFGVRAQPGLLLRSGACGVQASGQMGHLVGERLE